MLECTKYISDRAAVGRGGEVERGQRKDSGVIILQIWNTNILLLFRIFRWQWSDLVDLRFGDG